MICAQVGTRPVAASAAAAADLKRRNPGTFQKSYKPLIPRNATAPVPIMLGALEGPAALAPLVTDAPYFPLAMGPAWAGVPGARHACPRGPHGEWKVRRVGHERRERGRAFQRA